MHKNSLGVGSECNSAKLFAPNLRILLVEQIVEGLVNIVQVDQDTSDSVLNAIHNLRNDPVESFVFLIACKVASKEYFEDFVFGFHLRVDKVDCSLNIIGYYHQMSSIVANHLEILFDQIVGLCKIIVLTEIAKVFLDQLIKLGLVALQASEIPL